MCLRSPRKMRAQSLTIRMLAMPSFEYRPCFQFPCCRQNSGAGSDERPGKRPSRLEHYATASPSSSSSSSSTGHSRSTVLWLVQTRREFPACRSRAISDDQSGCVSVSSLSARPSAGRYRPKFNSKSLGTPNRYCGPWHGGPSHWARPALGRSCRCSFTARPLSTSRTD